MKWHCHYCSSEFLSDPKDADFVSKTRVSSVDHCDPICPDCAIYLISIGHKRDWIEVICPQ